MRNRDAFRWGLTTLPLTPMASVVYLFFEWLFFVTKPSSVAGLPIATQVLVLLKSPLPILLPLLGVQVVASALSMIAYPKVRGIALVPASVVLGAWLFVLTDNFTSTIFGFGVLSAGTAIRLVFAALMPSLVVLAGWTLSTWTGRLFVRPRVTAAAVALTIVCAIAPAAGMRAPAPPLDPNSPPGSAGAAAGVSQRPNILLLGIDGLDASGSSAYGYTRRTTPFLETVRDQSLFFENAFANVGRTHGSLVSLLTGRLPLTTHVTFPPTVLQGEDAHRHLPAVLKPLGYTTLQLGMRHYADAEDANLLGFDAANYRWQRLEDVHRGAATDEADAFRAAVAERLDERIGQLFGFRHAIDGFAHVEGRQESPYWSDERRVETLVRYFSIAPEPWFVHAHLLDTHCCAFHPSQGYFSNGPDPAEDSHDNQVRDADGHVRRLFEALEAGGRLDRTIIVVYSDHTLRWTTKGRVPLMFRFPDSRIKGRVAANAQLADVAPTILAYLRIAIPTWMDGESLLDSQRLAPGRPVFALSDVEAREPVAPFLTALAAADPPNYGARSATMIAGNQWFELSLVDGSLRTGPVPGHTGRGLARISEDEGRSILLARLTAAGFTVERGEASVGQPFHVRSTSQSGEGPRGLH